ncbi:acetylglutamate kinase [Bacillus sp. CGMCC 1.16541]|uniref:acetylglutamate kinase n=1 Tax=Bacillus sp. CGMCC 1.16541 TaxID=2185143 RepID=UPI000D7276ED|nr:acetylglutamate kinase [Bacillus sp. CGMCC 1.16541]
MSQTIVIKCGGSIVNELTSGFFQSIKSLVGAGHSVVIVHGGGPDIQHMLTELQIESEFIDGLRKTSKEVLEVVTMVLSGKVNKKLVNMLHQYDLQSVGLSGCDGMLLETKAINVEKLGYVGEVVNVNSELLKQLMTNHYVPVISSIGVNKQGEMFNINADLAASAVAQSIHAEKLLFVTDVQGVLVEEEVIEELTKSEITTLIEQGTIYGGMIPKVQGASQALSDTLKEVHIISGKHAFMDEHGRVIGTAIKHEKGGNKHDEFVISDVSTIGSSY